MIQFALLIDERFCSSQTDNSLSLNIIESTWDNQESKCWLAEIIESSLFTHRSLMCFFERIAFEWSIIANAWLIPVPLTIRRSWLLSRGYRTLPLGREISIEFCPTKCSSKSESELLCSGLKTILK